MTFVCETIGCSSSSLHNLVCELTESLKTTTEWFGSKENDREAVDSVIMVSALRFFDILGSTTPSFPASTDDRRYQGRR